MFELGLRRHTFARVKILFCPTHLLFNNVVEGSELSWAFNIADRVARHNPGSVIVTGRSRLDCEVSYDATEITPEQEKLNLSRSHALMFNWRYFRATMSALRRERFDLVHHVLPFALGTTYNLALLLPRRRPPFVIGPVQPPLEVEDTDVDPQDVRSSDPRPALRKFDAAYFLASPLLASMSRRTLCRAHRVIAVNETARELVIGQGVPARCCVVIPPGVDTERFSSPPRGARTDPVRILASLIRKKKERSSRHRSLRSCRDTNPGCGASNRRLRAGANLAAASG